MTILPDGRRVAVLIVTAVLASVSLIAAFRPADTIRVTASFPRTMALFPGADVRILGVKVGTVTKISPQGDTMLVALEYDTKHKVPADAKAAIVAPNIVADRFVQLTPAYRGGAVLKDGARIPVERTAVPVELDRIYGSLNELTVALGPDGVNKSGALSRLMKVGADNLDGQGQRAHDTVEGLAAAVGTLADGREDLFASVKNLQAFTSALAANDEQVRAFNVDLAAVAGQLAGERTSLSAVVDNLSVALGEVADFVRTNKSTLQANVDDLASVTRTLAKQRKALEEIIEVAPLGLDNLARAYNPRSRTVDIRPNLTEPVHDPALFLCALFQANFEGTGNTACDAFKGLLGGLPLIGDLFGSTGSPAHDLTLGGILEGAP